MVKKADKITSNKSIREQIRANKAKEFLDDDDVAEDSVLEEIHISDKKQVQKSREDKIAKLAKLEKIEKDIDELKVNSMTIKEFLEKYKEPIKSEPKDIPLSKSVMMEVPMVPQSVPNPYQVQNGGAATSVKKDPIAELKKNKISFS